MADRPKKDTWIRFVAPGALILFMALGGTIRTGGGILQIVGAAIGIGLIVWGIRLKGTTERDGNLPRP